MQLGCTRYFSKICVMGLQPRGQRVFYWVIRAEYHTTALSILRWAPGPKPIAGSVEKVGVEPDPKRVGPASWNLEYG